MNDRNQSSNLPCCNDSCCGEEPAASLDAQAVHEQVRDRYGAIALATAAACCCAGASGPETTSGCCGSMSITPERIALAVGYAKQDLDRLPEGAEMGLSCGNPTAIAELRPGEIVLDLGSGGGLDCFIAGPKVGSAGRVIGVDMTPEMISKARRNAAIYRSQSGLDNVEFRLGEIENLPVADASVDAVISNCVLNLSPDKPRVWREIARVLKPGGRVAISDLALTQPLPESIRVDIEALVGCIAGASLVSEIEAMATEAGLSEIVLTQKSNYIDAMAEGLDPLLQRVADELPQGVRPGEIIRSLDISARKPAK